MRDIRRRLEELEASSPPVTLLSSTADLCRYLAQTPCRELPAELASFADAQISLCIEEIEQYVPGYVIGGRS
jgi:hypothetical protein